MATWQCLNCKRTFKSRGNRLRKYCSLDCCWKYRVIWNRGKNTGKLSAEYRKKISRSLKNAHLIRKWGFINGHRAWNKGTKGVMKANSGAFKKGHPAPKTAFKKGHLFGYRFPKGHIPWNKGIKWLERRGENHHNWKGGKSRIYRKELLSFEDYRKYTDFQKGVFKRDNWNCQNCSKHGGELHAHHKKQWAKYPKLRFDINNGTTLCPPCHRKTNTYSIKDVNVVATTT